MGIERRLTGSDEIVVFVHDRTIHIRANEIESARDDGPEAVGSGEPAPVAREKAVANRDGTNITGSFYPAGSGIFWDEVIVVDRSIAKGQDRVIGEDAAASR